MAQDNGLCRKKRKCQSNGPNEPAHGPPLQARVAAANGTVLQLANMLEQDDKLLALTDPGAHGNDQVAKHNGAKWTGASKMNGANERGQELMRAVGMAGKMAGKQTARRTSHCRQNTAGRLSIRLRPQNKRMALSWPASQQNSCQMTSASRRAGGWGGSAEVLAAMKAGSDLPTVPTPN